MVKWRYEHCADDGSPIQTASVNGCALVVFKEHGRWWYTVHFVDQTTSAYNEATDENDAKGKAIAAANAPKEV